MFINELTKTPEHNLFNQTYNNMSMNGFWKYTTERFFILEECMRKFNLENVFHLEVDNLVYFNLQENLSTFKSFKSILIPSDNDTRFIAGVCFVNNTSSLQSLNHYFATNSHNRAEMEVIMNFAKITNSIKTLPTIIWFNIAWSVLASAALIKHFI